MLSEDGVLAKAVIGAESNVDKEYLVGVRGQINDCLLYTSDAADERSSVDLGGRRIIKKKKSIVRRMRLTLHYNNRTASTA